MIDIQGLRGPEYHRRAGARLRCLYTSEGAAWPFLVPVRRQRCCVVCVCVCVYVAYMHAKIYSKWISNKVAVASMCVRPT